MVQIGIVTSYDEQMTADVPADCVTNDNAVWFEPNEEYYPTNNDMLTQVSVTEKVYYYGALPSIPSQLPVYTLAYDPVLVPSEAFLEVYWYNESINIWEKIDDAVFNDTEAEFSTIYTGSFAVFANSYGILDLAVGDIEIDPEFASYTNTSPEFWTVVTYQGAQSELLLDVILNGYYLVEDNQTGPAPCEVDWDWCGIDEVNHILHIYGIGELDPETEYTLEIVLTDIYENEDSSEIIFNIDDEVPVVSNATYESLTFSADITDELTEVADVELEVSGLVKTLDQMTVTGDTYSYTFSYTELADALCEPFGFLTANWTAYDVLANYESYSFTYDYDLSYSITFDPFNGSYWYSPEYYNEFNFTVNLPEGVTIANNGVLVDFTDQNGTNLQDPTNATDLGNGDYSVNFSGYILPTSEVLTIHAVVTIISGDDWEAEQDYGIDVIAPIIDLANAVLPDPLVELGENIEISVSYEDVLSGIDLGNVVIYLNGDPVDATVTESNLMSTLDITEVGNYILVVSIPDMVGNVATKECEFVVGVTPYITVHAFAGGYWFNPAQNSNPFNFFIKDANGNTIQSCIVEVFFYEYPSGDMIQGPLNPTGNNGEYEVFFGGNLSPDGTAINMEIIAYTGFISAYDQAFSVDYVAPFVWVTSPIGDPIDNDGDGLYNEDWPDNINQDQDWNDLNGNGVWDWIDINENGVWDLYWLIEITPCGDTLCSCHLEPGEPGIVDEDPIDFYSPELPYGTDVTISFMFEDIPLWFEHPDTALGYYYSAASGINTENVQLLLNGMPVENLTISNGVLAYAAGQLDAGNYVATALILDNAGNVGTTQFEFDIIAPAPSVVFQPLLVGGVETWIVDPYDDIENEFRFAVNWKGNPLIVPNEVVVTYLEQGSETILDGPRTVEPTSTDSTIADYKDNLGSNVIDELTIGIILEVTATNIWGGSSTSRHTYMIMHSPELAFAKPQDLMFSDNPIRLGAGTKGSSSFNLSLTRNANVTIVIYDFSGKKVKTLMSNQPLTRLTYYPISWDGTDDKGNQVPRGGYITNIVVNGASGDVKGKTITKQIKIAVIK